MKRNLLIAIALIFIAIIIIAIKISGTKTTSINNGINNNASVKTLKKEKKSIIIWPDWHPTWYYRSKEYNKNLKKTVKKIQEDKHFLDNGFKNAEKIMRENP